MSDHLLLIIITICVVLITAVMIGIGYFLVYSFKKLQTTLDLVEETANDVSLVKKGVKSGILSLLSLLIEGAQKGDEC